MGKLKIQPLGDRVLVEPAEVGAESLGDLYVAMTRPTKQLRVVHHSGLPHGFEADLFEA